MQTTELYKIFLQHPSVKTDTRKLQPGDIFVALKGPNYNGNHYTAQAFANGAAYCITDETLAIKDERIILVNDSLKALQELAKEHRKSFSIPFIAITGSNGKTTTKELVHEVLSKKFRCYTTEGNLNNHIGIPLTILKIKRDAEIAVIEMGANHQKEIEGYCLYALPTHGNITNVGKAHLEGFGGEEGVKKGKGELFVYLKKNGGTAFVNADYDYLKQMSEGIEHIVTYGTTETADVAGKALDAKGFLTVCISNGADSKNIATKLIGDYNLPNVLTAVCMGKYFGVADDDIKKALEAYTPSNSRSQLIEAGSNKIILDAYNANPSSMKAAIENFAAMPGDKKILVLGAMMELGEESEKEHHEIVQLILKHQWEKVLLAGEKYTNVPNPITHVNTTAEASTWYKEQSFQDAQILIKGSRGMQMEKVLE